MASTPAWAHFSSVSPDGAPLTPITAAADVFAGDGAKFGVKFGVINQQKFREKLSREV